VLFKGVSHSVPDSQILKHIILLKIQIQNAILNISKHYKIIIYFLSMGSNKIDLSLINI